MKFKRYLALILLVCIISISAVSAADDAASDILSANDNQELILEETIHEDVSANVDDNEKLILEKTDKAALGSTDEKTQLKDEPKNFDQLNDDINGNDQNEIDLSSDYKYSAGDGDYIHGVIINRTVTINGHGITIDGSHIARIFNIGNQGNVKIININFINGNATQTSTDTYEQDGGAISAEYRNCVVENCNFTNNTAQYFGGALERVNANNCTFTQNQAQEGGAIFQGTANNCTFTQNQANKGGAIFQGTANNCTFTQNQANNGGAMMDGTANNCTFNENKANKGGAIYQGIANNCTFTQNQANKNGGAMYGYEYLPEYFNATLCIFEGNTPDQYKYIKIVPAYINASNFTSSYNSGEKLMFNLTCDGQAYDGINTTITITNDEGTVGTYYALTGEGWTVNLPIGTYKAVLSIDKYEGIVNGEATISIIKVPTSITAKNITASYNSNDNLTITLLDNATKAVANAEISVEINGETITKNTSSKGQVIIPVAGLDVKAYEVKIRFEGNEDYAASNATAKITIEPADSSVSAESKAITFGEAISIPVKSENATNVSYEIHEKEGGKVKEDIIKANGTISGFDLPAGEYTVSLTSIVDKNHNPTSSSSKLTIKKAASSISAKDAAGTFGETITMPIESENATKITYQIIDKDNKNVTNGTVESNAITLSSLDAGEYTAKISYKGNENYTGSSATAKITIGLANSSVTGESKTVPYGQSISIPVKSENATNVTFKILDKNGKAVKSGTIEPNGKITRLDLSAGEYSVNLTANVDKNHKSTSNISKLTIKKAASSISAKDVTADIGEPITIEVTSANATKMNYQIKDKNDNDVASGTIKANDNINIDNLAAGEYTVKINYSGNENYTGSSATAKITVNRETTELTAENVRATYNVDKDLVITLKDSAGNAIKDASVSVDLNGEKEYTTDENGEIKVSTKGLAPASYTAIISFAGDDSYAPSSANATVTVQKATPKITAKAKSFKYEDKTKTFTVTLVNNKGAALKNTTVILKVNGRTYSAKTNSKGVATFKLTKLTKTGTYTAVISYAGNKYYNKISAKAKVTVKNPAWKTIARGSKLKAMVKKIQVALKKNGYYIRYKKHYLKVDGIFDIYTEMAVKQFQKAKKLKVTGKVDYATAKKLKIVS